MYRNLKGTVYTSPVQKIQSIGNYPVQKTGFYLYKMLDIILSLPVFPVRGLPLSADYFWKDRKVGEGTLAYETVMKSTRLGMEMEPDYRGTTFKETVSQKSAEVCFN